MPPTLREIVEAYDAGAPLERAWTIPSDWYVDPRVAELENRTVFSRSWQMVGRVDQVAEPGQYLTDMLAGEPVLVVRGDDGRLRAFFNVCRHHAAAVMTEPQGSARNLRCPYHGWTYGLDGRLRGTPDFAEVCGFDREASGLVPMAVAIWESFVFVRLEPDASSHGMEEPPHESEASQRGSGVSEHGPGASQRDLEAAPRSPEAWTRRPGASQRSPEGSAQSPKGSQRETDESPLSLGRAGEPLSLLEFLGADLVAQFQPLGLDSFHFMERRRYAFECNWKVFVDNYLDGGYHVPFLHKGLDSVLDYARYTIENGRRHCLQKSPIVREGAEPQTGAVRRGEIALYYWIYPNFMVNWYEGVMDTNLVRPLGIDRTEVIFDFYFTDVSSEEARRRNLASIDVGQRIQDEDTSICRSVQVGLASRAYRAGRLSVRREGGEHLFHRLLHADLIRGLERTPASK